MHISILTLLLPLLALRADARNAVAPAGTPVTSIIAPQSTVASAMSPGPSASRCNAICIDDYGYTSDDTYQAEADCLADCNACDGTCTLAATSITYGVKEYRWTCGSCFCTQPGSGCE